MSRQTRFVLLILGVVGLIALEQLNDNVFLIGISLALILFPIVNWIVWAILFRASLRDPTIVSLASRADDAFVLALASTIGGALGIEVVFNLRLGRGFVEDAIALALLFISIPAVSWLRTWQTVWRSGKTLPGRSKPKE